MSQSSLRSSRVRLPLKGCSYSSEVEGEGGEIDQVNHVSFVKPDLVDFLGSFREHHPDLESVVSAWPKLPAAVRAGIGRW